MARRRLPGVPGAAGLGQNRRPSPKGPRSSRFPYRPPRLPARPRAAHKGDFGRVLIVAGSPGLTGAAALAARAATRSGAGLVTLAAPRGVWPILAVKLTAEMTLPLPETRAGFLAAAAARELARPLALADAVAAGPGLAAGAAAILPWLIRRARQPLVLDADALNALAAAPALLAERAGPTILTPHPGEMARLTGLSTARVQADRAGIASAFARRYNAVVVLKGAGTVVTDGRALFVNRTGNPGLATGGTGDVLTGVIAALLAQGLEPFAAAALGAHAHGLAGDLAAAELGETALAAEDVLDRLPAAWRRLSGRRRGG